MKPYTMIFFIKANLLTLFLCTCISNLGYSQKDHIVEFNADGVMTSAPPQVLPNGDNIIVKINIDSKSFEKRIYVALERYLTAMTTIKSDEASKYIFEDYTPLNGIQCRLGSQVAALSKKYLNEKDQGVIRQRLIYLGYTDGCNEGEGVPNLETLVLPTYNLLVSFVDGGGKKISDTKSISLEGALPTTLKDFSLSTIKEVIPVKTAEIRFELREDHLLNQEVQKRLTIITRTQVEALENALKHVKKIFNEPFMADYAQLNEKGEEAGKFLKNPRQGQLDLVWIDASNALLKKVDKSANDALKALQTSELKNWFLAWMWLTKGVPNINPFEFQAQPLFASPSTGSTKVTEKEKALVDLFDNMVSKGAFQIGSLPEAFKDSHMDRIADIKARLKTERAVTAANSNNYDILLYSGLLNTFRNKHSINSMKNRINYLRSSVPVTYMISHDAARDFVLMGSMQKEIKESDRLVVSLQNKMPEGVFKVELTTTAIAYDPSQITDEMGYSLLTEGAKDVQPGSITDKVLEFFKGYDQVNKKVQFLLSLNAAPNFPILFIKDDSPSWQTEILNYNQVIHAPSIGEYKIKSGMGAEEKEVYKGQFRVNKRYNLRFKAGSLYSFLEQTDYAQLTGNTFTETVDNAGVDGTFGLQIFPVKTDIRQINIMNGRLAPFLYIGLSMKSIKENFYPGVGLEIFSGLSVSYIHHIGRSEVLTGLNEMPQRIENKWVDGSSVSLLIDGSLFVNLFKFGSNKSLLGF